MSGCPLGMCSVTVHEATKTQEPDRQALHSHDAVFQHHNGVVGDRRNQATSLAPAFGHASLHAK